MSVFDQVRALEQQVLQRLRELRPLIAEYRDLEKLAERLGLKHDDDAVEAAPAEAAKSPARRPAAKPRAKRTASARPSKRPAARKPKAKAKPAAAAAEPPASSAPRTPKPAPAAKAKPAAASPPKRAAARGAGSGRKPSARKRSAVAPGQRQHDVLRLVRERPGITVAELATELEVDATGLYGVVRRLQAKGEINKDGIQLRPVDAATTSGDAATTAGPESAGRAPAAAEAEPGSAEPPARES